MTTPTREQVIADMQALGVPDLWLATLTDRAFEFIAKAAEHYTAAGRDQGLREAAELMRELGRLLKGNATPTTEEAALAIESLLKRAAAIEQLRGK